MEGDTYPSRSPGIGLAMTPVALIVMSRVKTPILYAGDRLESRTCRECAGDGKNHLEGLPPALGKRCLACGGDGVVNVILPGAERPTRIRGAVADAEKLQDFADYEPAWDRLRKRASDLLPTE